MSEIMMTLINGYIIIVNQVFHPGILTRGVIFSGDVITHNR